MSLRQREEIQKMLRDRLIVGGTGLFQPFRHTCDSIQVNTGNDPHSPGVMEVMKSFSF